MSLETRSHFLALLVLISFSQVGGLFAQSGWTQPKGEGFFKADASFFNSDRLVLATGAELETSIFEQYSLNAYAEYGVSDRLTLIASAPLLRANRFEDTDYAVGQGDLQLGGKYGLLTGSTPVSLELLAGIPTGRADAFADNREFADNEINLPTGDGEFDVWSTLAVSRAFGKAYASAYGAYNFRTVYEGDEFQDLYALGGELGYKPIDRLLLIAKVRSQLTTGRSESPTLSFLRGDATTFAQVQLEGMYWLNEHWILAACVANTNDWVTPTRNLYVGTSVSVGVAYELN